MTKKDSYKWYIFIAIILLFLIFLVLFLYYQTFGNAGLSPSQEQWGQFGDYLGGVLNPIFGFAAFIGLLYTIKLQQDSIRLQRTELEETRKELARSAKAQEQSERALTEQSKIFQQQQFEATFFSLLNQLNQLISKF